MNTKHLPRICIEASPAIQNQAGLGRYTSNLIDSLIQHDDSYEYTISFNKTRRCNIPDKYNKLKQYSSNKNNKIWRLQHSLTHFPKYRINNHYSHIDLYHSTGHLLPKLTGIPSIMTLHDIIPLLYPEYHKPLNRMFFKVMLPIFLESADAIIAVSKHTKDDAVNHLSLDPNKFVIIPEAVDNSIYRITDTNQLSRIRNKYKLPSKFILCLSTIEPRKNHITLLRAFEKIHFHHPDIGLVLVGNLGWLYKPFLSAIENSPVNNQIKLLGYVHEHDLATLISAATVFAFPSIYEGFGLPPLEAMMCSTPVICSNTSSLPEVVGDAAITCEPTNTDNWSDSLNKILSDKQLREELTAKGMNHAKQFTWNKVSKQTVTLYNKFLKHTK